MPAALPRLPGASLRSRVPGQGLCCGHGTAGTHGLRAPTSAGLATAGQHGMQSSLGSGASQASHTHSLFTRLRELQAAAEFPVTLGHSFQPWKG